MTATYSALRAHERCVAGLYADPDVTGDLLLVGMWLARAVHLRQPEPAAGAGWSLADIARDLFPLAGSAAMDFGGQQVQEQETGPDVWKVAEVLKQDIRRYDWRADSPLYGYPTCSGPMVRRGRCGRKSMTWALLTDLATGRQRMLGCCRQHLDWWQGEMSANRQECAFAEIPRPAANAGGALARHVDIDWPALWSGLDPQWVAPPEVDSWVRPNLRVIVSHLPARPEVGRAVPRPRFALIGGGAGDR